MTTLNSEPTTDATDAAPIARWRPWPLLGIVVAVLGVLTLLGSTPEVPKSQRIADPAIVLQVAREHRLQVMAFSGAGFLVWTLLIVYTARLRQYLTARQPDNSILPTLAWAGACSPRRPSSPPCSSPACWCTGRSRATLPAPRAHPSHQRRASLRCLDTDGAGRIRRRRRRLAGPRGAAVARLVQRHRHRRHGSPHPNGPACSELVRRRGLATGHLSHTARPRQISAPQPIIQRQRKAQHDSTADGPAQSRLTVLALLSACGVPTGMYRRAHPYHDLALTAVQTSIPQVAGHHRQPSNVLLVAGLLRAVRAQVQPSVRTPPCE